MSNSQTELAIRRLKVEYGQDSRVSISFVHSESSFMVIEKYWGVAVSGGNLRMHNAYVGAPSLEEAVANHIRYWKGRKG